MHHIMVKKLIRSTKSLDKWFLTTLNKVIKEADKHLEEYRFGKQEELSIFHLG